MGALMEFAQGKGCRELETETIRSAGIGELAISAIRDLSRLMGDFC
jgi:hypothetical protein